MRMNAERIFSKRVRPKVALDAALVPNPKLIFGRTVDRAGRCVGASGEGCLRCAGEGRCVGYHDDPYIGSRGTYGQTDRPHRRRPVDRRRHIGVAAQPGGGG
jgi:hypothetical protein